MADPKIINRLPAEGTEEVDPEGILRFGARDVDSRIDLSSVYSCMVFSQTNYAPEVLPQYSFGSDVVVHYDVFGDELPHTRPSSVVDRSIEETVSVDTDGDFVDDTEYGPVLRLEKGIDGFDKEKGVLYISKDVETSVPVGMEVTMSMELYTTGAADYFSDSAYAGVVLGLIHWQKNSAVFLFFKDDGATKSIVVAGPASDSSGTRESTETAFDWSDHPVGTPFAYKVVWDDSIFQEKVFVFVTDPETFEETLLAEYAIADLGELQTSARLGSYYAEEAPEKLTMFLGMDGGDAGDYLEVHSFKLHTFGVATVVSGEHSGSSAVNRVCADRTQIVPDTFSDKWPHTEAGGTSSIDSDSGSFVITKDADDTLDYYRRQEPSFEGQEWILYLSLAGRGQDHEGSFQTGMGFNLRDGTNSFNFRLLDDFADSITYGLLYDDTAISSTTSYYIAPASDSTDWSATTPKYLLLGSNTLDGGVVKVFQTTEDTFGDEDETPTIDLTSYALGVTSTEDAGIDIGFLDNDVQYGGELSVVSGFLLPNCTFYEPAVTAATPTGDWLNESTETLSAVADGRLSISLPATSGGYDYYYLSPTSSEYDATESGITALFKVKVTDWVDKLGVASSTRVETAPIVAIYGGEEDSDGNGLFVLLQFVQNSSGETYIYFAQDTDDYLSVLNQDELGSKYSALVDPTEDHVYMLSYQPGAHIQLFVDFGPVPVIDIEWIDKDGLLRESPNSTLDPDRVVAFGSISEEAAISCEIAYFRVSIGQGFDFEVTLDIDSTEVEESVYDSEADTLVDIMDED